VLGWNVLVIMGDFVDGRNSVGIVVTVITGVRLAGRIVAVEIVGRDSLGFIDVGRKAVGTIMLDRASVGVKLPICGFVVG
jgi:hypothetical protein